MIVCLIAISLAPLSIFLVAAVVAHLPFSSMVSFENFVHLYFFFCLYLLSLFGLALICFVYNLHHRPAFHLSSSFFRTPRPSFSIFLLLLLPPLVFPFFKHRSYPRPGSSLDSPYLAYRALACPVVDHPKGLKKYWSMYAGRFGIGGLAWNVETMNSNKSKSVTRADIQKKRESRAGVRKVASLTSEQLERKRANDREAQRTIRQRTKELIESLGQEVTELRVRNEEFDDVVRRNVSLQNEVRQLRLQLAVVTSNPAYSSSGECPPSCLFPFSFLLTTFSLPVEASDASPVTVLPTRYQGSFGSPTDVMAHASPVLSSSESVESARPSWQSYHSPSSSATGMSRTPESDYSNRMEPFMLPGPLPQQQTTVPQQSQPLNSISFSSPQMGNSRSDLTRFMATPSNGSLDEASAYYYQVPPADAPQIQRSVCTSRLPFEAPPRPASVPGMSMMGTHLGEFQQPRLPSHVPPTHSSEPSEQASQETPCSWLPN